MDPHPQQKCLKKQIIFLFPLFPCFSFSHAKSTFFLSSLFIHCIVLSFFDIFEFIFKMGFTELYTIPPQLERENTTLTLLWTRTKNSITHNVENSKKISVFHCGDTVHWHCSSTVHCSYYKVHCSIDTVHFSSTVHFSCYKVHCSIDTVHLSSTVHCSCY